MDTYGVLRELDYLRVAIDNLVRETMKFLHPGTQRCPVSEGKTSAVTIPELFKEQVRRIDGVAETLCAYMLPRS